MRQEDAPVEVPSDMMNRFVEEAEVAANEDPLEEDDRQTVAEPEPNVGGEADDVQAEPESAPEVPEPAPEMDGDDDEPPEVISSRIPVLIDDAEYQVDQELAHARSHMQVPIYVQVEKACSVDPKLDLARYMACTVCHYIFKN